MTRDERLLRLETRASEMVNLCDDLLGQIAEVNLKVRFALSLMRVRKQSAAPLLDASGHAPVELMDGYDAYLHGGREIMLSRIEREIDDMQTQLALEAQRESQNADTSDGASRPGSPREESREGDGGSAPGQNLKSATDAPQARD